MEANVPEAERERAGEVLVRIMNGALFELAQITREQAGLAPLETGEKTQAFMTQAVLSLSDSQAYPAPMVFELHRLQAGPGQRLPRWREPLARTWCIWAAHLLIIGIFAMLVRARPPPLGLAGPVRAAAPGDAWRCPPTARRWTRDREFAQLAHTVDRGHRRNPSPRRQDMNTATHDADPE